MTNAEPGSGANARGLRRTTMDEANQQHFDRISTRYRGAAESWKPLYQQAERVLAPLVRGADVLDIGNGGVFVYDPESTRGTTVVDVSPAMIAALAGGKVRTLLADARDLSELPESSFDVAVLMLVLHHVTGATYRDSKAQLAAVAGSVLRCLRPGGRVVVMEPVIRPLLHGLQRASFPIVLRALRAAGVPMIHFHSAAELRDAFALGWTEVRLEPLALDGRVDPLGAAFPGWITLPPWMRPTDYVLLHARRAA